jgi:CO dehydrogenase maturation factor
MKLAVSGKGGVGKTTISALIAMALRDAGKKVIAIDADPDSNLLACMGYPEPESVPPLVELKDFIAERTGVKPGTTGGMYKLNPKVDDIPEKYAVDVDGIKVLVAGAVKKGGAGCYCPENALVRALVSHLLINDDTSLVLDMEAGVEHLGRGTIGAVDRLLVIVEPGRRSVETALRIAGLAKDLNLTKVSAIGNRIRSEDDKGLLKETLGEIEFAGFVPYDEKVREAEVAGRSVVGASEDVDRAIRGIVAKLNK